MLIAANSFCIKLGVSRKMSLNIPAPPHYDESKKNIGDWIDELEMYMLAACGATVDPVRQRAILISTIGEAAKEVIGNFSAVQKDTYAHLKDALIAHYAEACNYTTLADVVECYPPMADASVPRLEPPPGKSTFNMVSAIN